MKKAKMQDILASRLNYFNKCVKQLIFNTVPFFLVH